MRKTLLASAIAASLALPALAFAQTAAPAEPASAHTLTANVGLYSQYIFRGLTQTNEEPALQGGFDYGHASGIYLGVWGSNISWLKENFTVAPGLVQGQYSTGGSLELDLYGGYKGSIGNTGLTYDVGLLYYWYPGTTTKTLPAGGTCFIGSERCPEADTLEVYGALGWKWLSAKYSYSLLDDTFGWPGTDGAWYLDLSAAVPIGETGLTAGVHYGIQKYSGNIPGTSTSYDDLLSYNDWRVSLAYDLGKVSKTFSGVEVGGMYTDTSSANVCGYGKYSQSGSVSGVSCTGAYPKNIADGQFAVWVKKTF